MSITNGDKGGVVVIWKTKDYISEANRFFIWKGTDEGLKNFFNEINKKQLSIKFDKKYSKSKIKFLDVLVYKDEQQWLQTILFID